MNDAGQNDIGDEEMALEAADLSEGNGIIRGRNNRPPVKLSTESRRVEVLAEITLSYAMMSCFFFNKKNKYKLLFCSCL